ncbi:MAG: hypothetical protein K8S00_11790, partial [Bacteroidales bacterium]|nr:hypothetical protein [Bacteroidales bacterium]
MKKITLCLILFLSTITYGQVDEIVICLPKEETKVQQCTKGFSEFTGEHLQWLNETGEPNLPYKSVFVLLPPDVDLPSVKVHISNAKWEKVTGEWDITPVPPMVTWDGEKEIIIWPEGKNIVEGRDMDIYEANAVFPAKPIVRVDNVVLRKWKLAQVFYTPFRYNPVERTLYRLVCDSLRINFSKNPKQKASNKTDNIRIEQIKRHAVNFDDAIRDYGVYAPSSSGRYIIITTDSIQDASTELSNFIASKEARGFMVQVITEDTWSGGAIGDNRADNLRFWLQNNYGPLNIEYVLLIGNPDPDDPEDPTDSFGDVPMKMCYPQGENGQYNCPTDFYFAELSSNNWDSDGDNYFGEYNDDFNGDPPRAAEIVVGRIPYYGSINDLDHILAKIITYENTYEADAVWRQNILLPMKPSDGITPGYHLGEEIKDNILTPNGWNYHRVYELDYSLTPPPTTTPCTVDNVTDAWNGDDFGGIFWWTHGNQTYAYDIMDLTHAATLDDEHPGFTFQCSCRNGEPSTTNNLGYTLLKNGCINTISATTVSFYSSQTLFAGTASNSGMTFEYSKRLINDEMTSGNALNDLRFEVGWNGGSGYWYNYLTFNIYGCPSVGLFTFVEAPTGQSDIVSNNCEPSNIDYINYQDTLISSISDGIKVWSFVLRDGGISNNDADTLSTNISALSITKCTSDSVAYWGRTIRKAAIFRNSDNNLIGEIYVTGPNKFDFYELINLNAGDDTSEIYDLYLSFETMVIDKEQFQFEINEENVVPAATASSGFTGFSATSEADGDKNRIVVSATQLFFSDVPDIVSLNHDFEVTVNATDANGSIDPDESCVIILLKNEGTGSLTSSTGLTRNLVNGISIWTDLRYDTEETFNIKVTGSLPQAISGDIF